MDDNNPPSLGIVVKIIGIVIVVIILIIVISKMGVDADGKIDYTKCRNYIAKYVQLSKLNPDVAVDDLNELKANCPVITKTFSGNNPGEVKDFIAESLRTEWSLWSSGQKKVFKGPGTLCHVYSKIDFKSKDKKITEIQEYLSSKKIQEEPWEGWTYWAYIRQPPAEAVINEELLSGLEEKLFVKEIDTSKTYRVVFLYVQGETDINKFLQKIEIPAPETLPDRIVGVYLSEHEHVKAMGCE